MLDMIRVLSFSDYCVKMLTTVFSTFLWGKNPEQVIFLIFSDETADIITFGRSTKRSLDESHIGMYGNGLKS